MPAEPAAARLRVLLAGDWHSEIHEEAWAQGLSALGHEVLRFPWHARFGGLLGRVQNRLLAGPALARLNRELLALALREKPAALVLYRGTHVLPETLRALRSALPRCVIASYNNDDPFSEGADPRLWRHYRAALPLVDLHLVYREKSLRDLRERGFREVHLIRSAFIPEKDRGPALAAGERARLACDVLFAGHYEADGRADQLLALKREQPGLRVLGPEWQRAPAAVRRALAPGPALRGRDYAAQLSCARISLCFFSGLNHDTYTRRCFEIPAVGSLLLCQRSADAESLFLPGEEAAFFGGAVELCAQVRRYLADEPLRARVAQAGQDKVRAAGHDIVSRMREVEALLVRAREAKGG